MSHPMLLSRDHARKPIPRRPPRARRRRRPHTRRHTSSPAAAKHTAPQRPIIVPRKGRQRRLPGALGPAIPPRQQPSRIRILRLHHRRRPVSVPVPVPGPRRPPSSRRHDRRLAVRLVEPAAPPAQIDQRGRQDEHGRAADGDARDRAGAETSTTPSPSPTITTTATTTTTGSGGGARGPGPRRCCWGWAGASPRGTSRPARAGRWR